MQARALRKVAATSAVAFDVKAFFESAGVGRTTRDYAQGEAIFTQGQVSEHVLYITAGTVKLSVLSKSGREAVVAMLGPDDFFGEGCLAGQLLRMGSATATTPSTILCIEKAEMVKLLHRQRAMSDRFIAHMLSRNIRIEEDLIDQLFNSAEKRLARLRGERAAVDGSSPWSLLEQRAVWATSLVGRRPAGRGVSRGHGRAGRRGAAVPRAGRAAAVDAAVAASTAACDLDRDDACEALTREALETRPGSGAQ